MKTLIALLLVAMAMPALAEPKKPVQSKGAQLDKQNQAIDKGMQEAREKADITMSRRHLKGPRHSESEGKNKTRH
jgi:hypothetical protein